MNSTKSINHKFNARLTRISQRIRLDKMINMLILTLLFGNYNVLAETQFIDNFDTLDQSIWIYPTGDASFNGRTQMRDNYPEVSNGLLHLRLDTYN